mgnify:CR=1 FL=1
MVECMEIYHRYPITLSVDNISLGHFIAEKNILFSYDLSIIEKLIDGTTKIPRVDMDHFWKKTITVNDSTSDIYFPSSVIGLIIHAGFLKNQSFIEFVKESGECRLEI